MKWATFNRFEIQLPEAAVEQCHHSGSCDSDVEFWVEDPDVVAEFDKIGPEVLREELREYGAWDEDELADDGDNRRRILWLAAGNIQDEEFADSP